MVHLHSGPSVLYPDCLFPPLPRGATGTGPFRREPFNSAGGTCTHERNHLHGLLQRVLKISRGVLRRGGAAGFVAPQSKIHEGYSPASESSFLRRSVVRFAHSLAIRPAALAIRAPIYF